MEIDIFVAIIGFIGILVASYIGSWYANKGALEIAKKESLDRYKFAALDERLKIAQQAFNYSYDIEKSMSSKTEEKAKQLSEITGWWCKNCLYLETKSRKAFFDTLNLAKFVLPALKQKWESGNLDTGLLLKEWYKLFGLRNIIEDGVGIPIISEELPKPDNFIEVQTIE